MPTASQAGFSPYEACACGYTRLSGLPNQSQDASSRAHGDAR